MDPRPDNQDGWTWHRPTAALRCGPIAGEVDVDQPPRGLHRLRLHGTEMPGHLLGVDWTAAADRQAQIAPADAYLRGDDLVARYASQPGAPFAPQVYWRCEAVAANGPLAALSLWVSIETQLLDSHPCVHVDSHLPADEVLRVFVGDDGSVAAQPIAADNTWSESDAAGASCALWRLPGGRVSCAQFARKRDVREFSIHPHPSPLPKGEGTGCRWGLFADFLEKGVIRRACLQTVFLAREDDVAQAAACWRAFQSQPLPLTA